MDNLYRYQRSFVVSQAYNKLSQELRNDKSFDIIHNHALYHTPLLHADSYNAPMLTTLHTPPFKEIAKGGKLAAERQQSHFVTVSNIALPTWASSYPLGPHLFITLIVPTSFVK